MSKMLNKLLEPTTRICILVSWGRWVRVHGETVVGTTFQKQRLEAESFALLVRVVRELIPHLWSRRQPCYPSVSTCSLEYHNPNYVGRGSGSVKVETREHSQLKLLLNCCGMLWSDSPKTHIHHSPRHSMGISKRQA